MRRRNPHGECGRTAASFANCTRAPADEGDARRYQTVWAQRSRVQQGTCGGRNFTNVTGESMKRGFRFWLRGKPRGHEISGSQNVDEGQDHPLSPSQCATEEPREALATTSRPPNLVEQALERLTSAWAEQARTHGPQCLFLSAEVVAQLFASNLRTQLFPNRRSGCWIASTWIRAQYPLFCKSLHLVFPPPYKDFAHELAKLFSRRRREDRETGKRIRSYTVYYI